MHCAKIGWNWLGGSGEEDFRISSMYMYFPYFVIISPWKKVVPFIWMNLNSHHPRMNCATFSWNWPSGSEDFLNFVNVFSLYPNNLPLEEVRALHLNKLESPSPKDSLCQVCLKLAWWYGTTWAFGSGELKTTPVRPPITLKTTKHANNHRFSRYLPGCRDLQISHLYSDLCKDKTKENNGV